MTCSEYRNLHSRPTKHLCRCEQTSSCGLSANGSLTTTMPLQTCLSKQRNFCRNTTFCCCHTFHIHLTLLPSDFFLFSHLKKTLKGRLFDELEEIQTNATRQMKVISQSEFQRCFQKCQNRWNTCNQ